MTNELASFYAVQVNNDLRHESVTLRTEIDKEEIRVLPMEAMCNYNAVKAIRLRGETVPKASS
ncbi:hypothetical protein Lal_00021290 [Lupinus albus]|nr:hypothetical protein Lal_00021290 [Lupinus albus]